MIKINEKTNLEYKQLVSEDWMDVASQHVDSAIENNRKDFKKGKKDIKNSWMEL